MADDLLIFLIAVQIAYSLTISGSGNYIIPNTCYELTCSYDTFKDDRRTVYNIIDDKSYGIKSITIRYFNSTGLCFYRNPNYVPCTDDVCSCDKDGMATHICYNHTSRITGIITIHCFSGNSSIIRIPVAVGPGDSMEFIPPSTHDIKILGESLGPITCSASCYLEYDDGIYSCKAWNNIYALGKTMEFNLTVNSGPESVSLLPLDTKYTVTEGNDILSISCMADCKPACDYTLALKEREKEIEYQFSYALTYLLFYITVGPGSCMQFEPSITAVTKKKGDTLGPINCAATCNPPCQYKMIKPDKTVSIAAQLMLASLSIEDQGQFICTASNVIGSSVNKSLDVIVNCKYH
ncbi:unnamed protein product [Mytilus coruscus]|uniref:Ig-like domain-containing protein n=1 Tax=Mytilus coruscus TaxID=42192 RepID=A0A6J8A4X0_MYTCO|nr:unnamed protein product [Mytilus coruscus]